MPFAKPTLTFALLSCLAILPNAAAAENHALPDLCTFDPIEWEVGIAPLLDGHWGVNSLKGTLQFGSRVMVLPVGEPSEAGITLKADGLWISSELFNGEFPLTWIDPSISWDFTADESVPLAANEFLDDEDIAVLVGCNDADTLPRLEARGTISDPEGNVEFHMMVYVIGANSMYGVTIGVLNGGQGTARRILHFTR